MKDEKLKIKDVSSSARLPEQERLKIEDVE